jgi:hypothetical protein
MNTIVDTQQEIMGRDMPVSTSVSLTLFFGATLCGLYFFDLFKRVKQSETSVQELSEKVSDTIEHQEVQDETLREYDQRIREKKDFDESEEIEYNKYQAWSGFFQDSKIALTIRIWREKQSTFKKNLEWVNWDKSQDGSCIVRDFYLGNSNPEFSWILHTLNEPVHAEMKDTLINGWDSVCKIHIIVTASKGDILEFLSKDEFEGSQTLNLLLKKTVEEERILWSRILIDA